MKSPDNRNRKDRSSDLFVPSYKALKSLRFAAPSAALALLLANGCSNPSQEAGGNNPAVLDGPLFKAPVAIPGLPGHASVAGTFSSYYMFHPGLADVDDDGDLDLFAGSLSTNSSASSVYLFHKVLFFENDFDTAGSLEFTGNQSTYNLPEFYMSSISHSTSCPMFVAVGNIDADADINIITDSNHYYSFGSYSTHGYTVRYSQNIIDAEPASEEGYPDRFGARALADLDNDGDLDLIESSARYWPGANAYTWDNITYQVNDGSGTFSFGGSIDMGSEVSGLYNLRIPTFADLDSDGDQDMFTVSFDTGSSTVTYWENTDSSADKDSPSFEKRTYTLGVTVPADTIAFPVFGDMDGDTDLDVIIGTDSGELLYMENLDINL